jgi:Tfp pilus assembly protein PilP
MKLSEIISESQIAKNLKRLIKGKTLGDRIGQEAGAALDAFASKNPSARHKHTKNLKRLMDLETSIYKKEQGEEEEVVKTKKLVKDVKTGEEYDPEEKNGRTYLEKSCCSCPVSTYEK